MCEVSGADYMDHMCENVGMPPLQETPPPLHLPTPRPAPSIFHEMMVRYCLLVSQDESMFEGLQYNMSKALPLSAPKVSKMFLLNCSCKITYVMVQKLVTLTL
jgi:hypothetical protein